MSNENQRPKLPEMTAEDMAFNRRIFFSLMFVGLVLLVSLALPSLREMFAG
ncbi:hypothetical protein [Magnetospirillum moscoviense]|uniref:hypothetical protein n=1 Tax=Magnetospirillum moscoviense TaxID=1437059 RepID=UPI000AA7FE0F|nr:hypothetical protein [Magnetospirillum moscoviense]